MESPEHGNYSSGIQSIRNTVDNPGGFSEFIESQVVDFVEKGNRNNAHIRRVLELYEMNNRHPLTIGPMSIGGICRSFDSGKSLADIRSSLEVGSLITYRSDEEFRLAMKRGVQEELSMYLLEDLLKIDGYSQERLEHFAYGYLKFDNEYITKLLQLSDDISSTNEEIVDLKELISFKKQYDPTSIELSQYMQDLESKYTMLGNLKKEQEFQRESGLYYGSISEAIKVLLSKITDKARLISLSQDFPIDNNISQGSGPKYIRNRLDKVSLSEVLTNTKSTEVSQNVAEIMGDPMPFAPLLSDVILDDFLGISPISPIHTGNVTDPLGRTITYTATGLPSGLRIDSATGIITGTCDTDPISEYGYHIIVIATPAGGNNPLIRGLRLGITDHY
ncbi:Ig domain-containing protein [Candidatus Gracilibacteria bacterium]|nr:Ig domain-containing protein [Candidatus Gracilibacteria bacterium]